MFFLSIIKIYLLDALENLRGLVFSHVHDSVSGNGYRVTNGQHVPPPSALRVLRILHCPRLSDWKGLCPSTGREMDCETLMEVISNENNKI